MERRNWAEHHADPWAAKTAAAAWLEGLRDVSAAFQVEAAAVINRELDGLWELPAEWARELSLAALLEA